MEDLKLMTVRALRELARTHLGPGYSRLKTKAELITALAKKLADDAKAAKAAVRPEPKKAEPRKPEPKVDPKKPEPKLEAKVEAQKPEPRVEAKVEAKKPEPRKQEKQPEKPPADHRAEILATLRPGATLPESGELAVEASAVEESTTVADDEAARELPAAAAGDELTVQEKPAAPPPPRVKSQAELDLEAEGLGELPWGYQDDAVELLARDPHTLYVYWDFAEQTRRRAQEGLGGARAVLRLFDGGHLVREVDVSLESRSWYLHHVTPGRRYRAELHFVDERGAAKRVGPSSNAMLVPNEGPSPVIEDRFINLPWEIPFHRAPELLEHAHTGGPFPAETRDHLMARAEEGLQQEGMREVGPGETEIYWEIVRGLGGSETLTEIMRRRTRFGGQWTSSRPASAWTSSRPL